jgi:hypothetical protein
LKNISDNLVALLGKRSQDHCLTIIPPRSWLSFTLQSFVGSPRSYGMWDTGRSIMGGWHLVGWADWFYRPGRRSGSWQTV